MGEDLPEWMSKGHNRTGLKLLIIVPEDYTQLLGCLSSEEQAKLHAVNEALSTASEDEQESYKLTLAEILGYVALLKYCSVDKIVSEVKDKITENPRYHDLVKRASLTRAETKG